MSPKELLRICSSQGVEMSAAIAHEAQTIVRRASGFVVGLTVKGQIREACRSLGYPDNSWRVREAWYGQAGSWSAQAVRDLQDRYVRWRERQDRLVAQAKELETAKRVAAARQPLEAPSADYLELDRRLAVIEQALGLHT